MRLWPRFTRKRETAPQRVSTAMAVSLASDAGAQVTPETAQQVSAFYCGQTIIGNVVATTPIHVYRRRPDEGRDEARDHPAWRLLQRQPNPEMTPYRFRRYLQRSVLLWGNGYAEIERDGAGRPVALWPIPPSRVKVGRSLDTGELLYEITNDPGVASTLRVPAKIYLAPEDVFHVRHDPPDGVVGVSLVYLMAETLGITLAAEHYGARFFANNAQPSLLLKHPAQLKPDAAQRLRESWRKVYGGDSVGGVAVVEEGMEVERLSMPHQEAQFLETRSFQVVDIARFMNLPPHKLKDLSRATFSNIEEQSIEAVMDCYLPWFAEWEQECDAKLLAESERDTMYCEYVTTALMRGNIAGRYEAYAKARNNGWLSADEIRALENLNPLPDGLGKTYLVASTMLAAEQVKRNAELAMESPTPIDAPATPAEPVDAAPVELPTGDVVDDVQQTGLNGAQVTALQELIASVTAKLLPPDAVSKLISLAFPALPASDVAAMVSSAAAFSPSAPPVTDVTPEPVGDDLRALTAEVLAEAWSRVVRKHTKGLQTGLRKSTPAEAVAAWHTPKWEAECRAVVDAPLRAARAARGLATPQGMVDTLVREYLADAAESLLSATSTTGVLGSWEQTRAGEWAARSIADAT